MTVREVPLLLFEIAVIADETESEVDAVVESEVVDWPPTPSRLPSSRVDCAEALQRSGTSS